MYPLMPLAEAAREANHDVVFATCGEFVPKLERLGFPVESVGISIEQGRDEFLAAGATLAGENGQTDMKAGADCSSASSVAGPPPNCSRVAEGETRPRGVRAVRVRGPVAAGVAGIPAVAHALSPQLPAAVPRADRSPAGTAPVG